MTQKTPAAAGESEMSTKAFHAAYLIAVGVATVGWVYFLGACATALMGY